MAAATTCSSGDLAGLRRDHPKGTLVTADALEAAEADLCFAVASTDRSVALFDVTAIARAKGTRLDTNHVWTRQ